MCFPAKNLELSPKLAGFYDENGVYVDPQAIPLFYACSFGHIFKLQDIKTVNGQENMSRVSGPIPVS
jgi:hypothetical protein